VAAVTSHSFCLQLLFLKQNCIYLFKKTKAAALNATNCMTLHHHTEENSVRSVKAVFDNTIISKGL
jgi:hypothetical protein